VDGDRQQRLPDLIPGEPLALEEEHLIPLHRHERRRGGPARSPAHDHHVERLLAHRLTSDVLLPASPDARRPSWATKTRASARSGSIRAMSRASSGVRGSTFGLTRPGYAARWTKSSTAKRLRTTARIAAGTAPLRAV